MKIYILSIRLDEEKTSTFSYRSLLKILDPIPNASYQICEFMNYSLPQTLLEGKSQIIFSRSNITSFTFHKAFSASTASKLACINLSSFHDMYKRLRD